MTSIAIIGTGYVGLSTVVGLSELGHSVVGIDINESTVNSLNSGFAPIAEIGMNQALAKGLADGRLSFTTDVLHAISDALIVFLCLPTPQGDDGSADLSYIEAVARQIGRHLPADSVVVNKSTVPVGSSVKVAEWLDRHDVSVVSNPEFLRQGTALHDFLHPTRIVVGGDNEDAVRRVAALYAEIDAPLLTMNAASAEALKYAANSFLATKLTFVNAIADICELVGADIFDVVKGLGLDPRIGDQFLNPGPGWGGSCFPKDTRALVKIAESKDYDFALLRGVIQTNDEQYERIAKKVVEVCGGSVQGKIIASWGLTFKANTDDLRDSPAIAILSMLHNMGATIRAYDSAARGVENYPWIQTCASAIDACDGADALAVLTEWPEFSQVAPHDVREKLNQSAVVDGRNILNPTDWKSAGFEYRGVGRA
ncbi:MAG: nucleotide sugar dehydrogenase [Actinobacteria bacterium]|nr:nucleotide sugar dehydrogenase [Actinomycetota bacterium]